MTSESDKDVDVQRLVEGVFRDEWMVKTGVGGVLSAGGLVAILYSFTCLPLLAALWAVTTGYSLRCMRLKAADCEARLPAWNDWGDLFISGITWIALQTGIWLSFIAAIALIFALCIGYAFNEKSTTLSLVWTIGGSLFVILILTLLSVLSAYVMVNFAIEENARAGLAYLKITRSLLRSPGKLLCGFLLAAGIQLCAIVIPCLTIVGIFLVPSTSFIGSLLSSIVLARHWCACNELPDQKQTA